MQKTTHAVRAFIDNMLVSAEKISWETLMISQPKKVFNIFWEPKSSHPKTPSCGASSGLVRLG